MVAQHVFNKYFQEETFVGKTRTKVSPLNQENITQFLIIVTLFTHFCAISEMNVLM